MGWWSPDPRAIIPLDGLRISRSLQKSCRRFDVRVDTAFADVIEACADRRRPGGWITGEIREAYVELHRLGWAHSMEAWSVDDGSLSGGLYGVAIGGLFAGESMFHRRTDASKVALVALVERLRDTGPGGTGPVGRLLDVQWRTDHLATMGAVDVPRPDYLGLLDTALRLPLPVAFR
jgi:leucyl/phenylalanyl-tRNA--protein transferase